MNKHIIHGKWHEMKGRLKQRWGWLTENDLVRIKGNGEEIRGILQKRYGYTKVEVRKGMKELMKSASMQHFQSLALQSKAAVSKSIRANPVKAVIVALSAGVLLGHLRVKK